MYRNGKELMEEIRQDFLDSMGDTELGRIILKHFDTDNPSPDVVRKICLEHDKYLLHYSHKGFKEITQT